MPDKLYWNTVTPLLKRTLQELMHCRLFDSFRMVGETSLSLQLGHRMSDDIDLFTDAPYGSIDMSTIDIYLREHYDYVYSAPGPVGMGKAYAIGNTAKETIKLDLFYTDPFIYPPLLKEQTRLATLEEIVAMKIDIVQRTARKKDFWDIHELLDQFSIEQMIRLHESRYPYTHDKTSILTNFTSFTAADQSFDPKCLRGKYWEIIKLEITEAVENYA